MNDRDIDLVGCNLCEAARQLREKEMKIDRLANIVTIVLEVILLLLFIWATSPSASAADTETGYETGVVCQMMDGYEHRIQLVHIYSARKCYVREEYYSYITDTEPVYTYTKPNQCNGWSMVAFFMGLWQSTHEWQLCRIYRVMPVLTVAKDGTVQTEDYREIMCEVYRLNDDLMWFKDLYDPVTSKIDAIKTDVNVVTLQVTAEPGKVYAIEQSDDLETWTLCDGYAPVARGYFRLKEVQQ